MNLWGWFKNLGKSIKVVFGPPDMGTNRVDYLTDTDPELVSNINTALRFRSETLAKLPIEYVHMTDNGVQDYTDHPYYELLKFNPNPFTSAFTFWEDMEYQRDRNGSSFARIHRDRGGLATKFTKLNYEDWSDYRETANFSWYKFSERWVRGDNILHFRHVQCLSPIVALALQLGLNTKAYQTINQYYRNGARNTRFIKSQLGMSQLSNFTGAVEDLNNKAGELEAQGKLLPLPPNTEVQDLGMNLKDVDFLPSIKETGNQIYQAFGVSFLDPSQSKYNNLEQMINHYYFQTLSAVQKRYVQELELKLLSWEARQRGEKIAFENKELFLTDLKSRVEAFKELHGISVMNGNQIADEMKLPRYEGGEIHWIAANNMQPIDKYNADLSSEAERILKHENREKSTE